MLTAIKISLFSINIYSSPWQKHSLLWTLFFRINFHNRLWNTHNEPTHAANTLPKQHIKFSFHSIRQQPRPDVPDFSFSLHFPKKKNRNFAVTVINAKIA